MGCNSSRHNDTDPVPMEQVQPPVPEPIAAQPRTKLQHMIESIYDAAARAQANVQMNNIHNFLTLFPENEQGVRTPKACEFHVNDTLVNVPLAALMNHQNLCISEIKITTNIGIELLDPPLTTDNSRTVYNLNLNEQDKSATLEIIIKGQEPIEAHTRILSRLEQNL
jgi:hypothetical protein